MYAAGPPPFVFFCLVLPADDARRWDGVERGLTSLASCPRVVVESFYLGVPNAFLTVHRPAFVGMKRLCMFANKGPYVHNINYSPPPSPPPDCRRPPSGAPRGDRLPPESFQVDKRCAAAAAGARVIVVVVYSLGVACLGRALPVGGFGGLACKV